RNKMNRRARNGLLTCLGLFLLSQLGMRLWIDRRRPEFRDPTFEIKYRLLERQLAQKPASAFKVIFTGSSMTAHGVRADKVEQSLTAALDRPVVSFNMASNGAGPLTQLIHVQRLLRRGVRPDLLVIELSPLSYDYADAPSDLARFPADRLERGDLGIVQQFCGKESLRK